MIPYVEERLQEWATWSHIRADGGGWRVRQFDYTEHEVRAPAQHVTRLPVAERALETEACVALLYKEHWRLGACVTAVYREHPEWGAAMISESFGISSQTVYRWLQKSHLILLEYFIDRSVGLVPQTERLRRTRSA